MRVKGWHIGRQSSLQQPKSIKCIHHWLSLSSIRNSSCQNARSQTAISFCKQQHTQRQHQQQKTTAAECGLVVAVVAGGATRAVCARMKRPPPGGGTNVATRLLALLLLLSLLAQGSCVHRITKELKRQTAKRWRHVAEISRLRARSAARHFLEERGAVSSTEEGARGNKRQSFVGCCHTGACCLSQATCSSNS